MRGTRRKLAVMVVLVAAAASPAVANAAEAVPDGGFEQSGSGWTVDPVAGFCTTGTCAGRSAFAGSGWGELAGGLANPNTNQVGQLRQSVTISPPATLTLMLRVEPGAAGTRRFTVLIDDNIPLEQITEAEDAAFASYAPVTVPLDAYPGTHTIKLHGQSLALMNQPHALFQVDNVSIQVPDPPVRPDTGSDADIGS